MFLEVIGVNKICPFTSKITEAKNNIKSNDQHWLRIANCSTHRHLLHTWPTLTYTCSSKGGPFMKQVPVVEPHAVKLTKNFHKMNINDYLLKCLILKKNPWHKTKKKSLTQKIHSNINTCKYIIPNEKYTLNKLHIEKIMNFSVWSLKHKLYQISIVCINLQVISRPYKF